MKRHAPATARNSEAIAEVLVQELPDRGTVLEIASGSGEHAVFFARRFSKLTWQPSDADAQALASIDAYAQEAQLANLEPSMMIDASSDKWAINCADAIICINMVHVSPWAATEGLLRGASRLLTNDAPLVLYGPYLEPDVETAPSNLEFDRGLKARDPRWGLRSLEDMDALAEGTGFRRAARHAMPANNLTVIYRKTARP